MALASADVVLVVSPPAHQLPALQPYCLAAEALLRFAHVDFDKVVEPTAAPVPRVEGAPSAVSSAREGFDCVRRCALPARSAVSRQDAELTPAQRALAESFREMCDRCVAPAQVYLVSGTQQAWESTKAALSRHIGVVRKWLLPSLVTRQDALRASGAQSAHDAVSGLSTACQALSDQLGSGDWMLGTPQPTSLDAVVFGHLGSILYAAAPCDANEGYAQLLGAVQKHANLVRLCERVRMKYFEVYSLSFHLRSAVATNASGDEASDAVSTARVCAGVTLASAAFMVGLHVDFLRRVLEYVKVELEAEE